MHAHALLSCAACAMPRLCHLQRLALLLLARPALRWLSIQVVAWGMVACTFSTMTTATHFYVLRLALGLCESGAFPGLWSVLNR